MKIENISPCFWDSFLKEFVRFLTSRYGKDPANAKQGGPGGKLEGLIDALIQRTIMITKIATMYCHMVGRYCTNPTPANTDF